MNEIRSIPLIGFILCTLLLLGQNYKMDWYTIDGGARISSGGSYSLISTVGQLESGLVAGGDFKIEGGFWGGAFAIQQEGAPRLIIRKSGDLVRISWNPDATGFVLQVSESLSPPDWTVVAGGDTTPTSQPATDP